jgi:pilus assembly protein CpaB
MNKNVLIVLAGGFVVAILVAVLVQASLGGKKVEDKGPKTQVLVAAKDLAIGTEISAGDLKWQTWPGEKAFNGAIVRKNDENADDALKGRLVQRVASGQPVLSSYMFKEGKGNLVAATLGRGMRAMSIAVKPQTMAGGFVSPGDFVDVILIHSIPTNTRSTPDVASIVSSHASETILQNVKVVAVDQESSRDEDQAKVAKTVTLEVTTEGAEKLALGSKMGELTLSLRGIGDSDVFPSTPATTDVEMSGVMRDVADVQNTKKKGSEIRVYNGTQIYNVTPRNGLKAMQAYETEQAEDEEKTVGENSEANPQAIPAETAEEEEQE